MVMKGLAAILGCVVEIRIYEEGEDDEYVGEEYV